MAATRRTQLLMDADELSQLRALARRGKTSVAELIRCAVRESYPKAPADRESLVNAILDLKLPNIDWKKAKQEVQSARANLIYHGNGTHVNHFSSAGGERWPRPKFPAK